MDFTNMTNEELAQLQAEAEAELGRRQTAGIFEQKISALLDEGQAAGVIVQHEDGEPWQPVTGYHNVYRKNAVVEYEGKQYISLIDFNTLKPSESGWREILPADEDGNEQYPVWKAPQGYQDAYSPGDRVWYPDENGTLYENVHTTGNSWEPGVPGSQWKIVD